MKLELTGIMKNLRRFWKKIDKTTSDKGCWLWTGRKNSDGYGIFDVGAEARYTTHRFMWEVTFGAIPKGLCVCHKCDVPACVNPNHFFLGTHQENMQDSVSKGRLGANQKGAKNHNAKLNENKVQEIRNLLVKGCKQSEIAQKFSISRYAISDIATGKRWNHLPFVPDENSLEPTEPTYSLGAAKRGEFDNDEF